MNKLLWHLELPGVEGLVVRDVALCLGDGDNHVVPLLAIYLLCRDGPLEMVLLQERKKTAVYDKTACNLSSSADNDFLDLVVYYSFSPRDTLTTARQSEFLIYQPVERNCFHKYNLVTWFALTWCVTGWE